MTTRLRYKGAVRPNSLGLHVQAGQFSGWNSELKRITEIVYPEPKPRKPKAGLELRKFSWQKEST